MNTGKLPRIIADLFPETGAFIRKTTRLRTDKVAVGADNAKLPRSSGSSIHEASASSLMKGITWELMEEAKRSDPVRHPPAAHEYEAAYIAMGPRPV